MILSSHPTQRGFTLIELMVTLAILAVLLMLATPSFVGFKRSSELTTAANSFVATLGAARGEAMKRSLNTLVLPLDSSDWTKGWVAFVDNNFNGTYEADTDTLITRRDEALPSYFTMTKNGITPIKYNGSGYSIGVLSTIEIARNDLSGNDLLAQTRRIKIISTGRVRICTPKANPDSNCLSTSN